MTNQSRLKLIEHSIPIEAINKASSREKSVRHGHPSTLHLWWARRPLAACRAVLFAQLVDDPSAWPNKFPTEDDQRRERLRLHKVIEEMVEWPKSSAAAQKEFERNIEAARYEIARSVAWGLGEEPPSEKKPQAVIDYLQKKGPPVYDPFCGGGSIPLEAQRLGLRAYGSDLNPVAVLITKALIEFPPKFAGLAPVHPAVANDKSLIARQWKGAQGLAEDVRRYGEWMRDEAEKKIGRLYPQAELSDGSKATVIAWLWARTVASPDPKQKGRHVPLVSSFVLSSKKGKEAIVIPVKDDKAKDGWRFTVKASGVTKGELEAAAEGTIGRSSGGTCFLSGASMPFSYVRERGKVEGLGVRLMAIVAEGTRGRTYLAPDKMHERCAEIGPPDAPELDQPLPNNPRDFKTPNYGLGKWIDLFTPRQLTALTTFSDLVKAARERVFEDAKASLAFASRKGDEKPLAEGGAGPTAYADAVATYLAFAVNKCLSRNCSLAIWEPGMGRLAAAFGRQAIPMQWSYAETQPFAGAGGDFMGTVDSLAKPLAQQGQTSFGEVKSINAPENNYPVRPTVICTDPPYYDNIGYADLSDFFYVWLRRSIGAVHPDLFRRLVTPKAEELVATPYRHGGKGKAEKHFMEGMKTALQAMRNASAEAPLAIYYAFKQSEAREGGVLSPGWAAFLQAAVSSGLHIDGTWPVRTEATNALKKDINALASSVVLVCRARPDDAPIISRRDFVRELKLAMREAIKDHQEAGIPLPDRRQAAIGPGIGVFSKYKAVREVDDSEMTVATALALINKEIDEILAEGTEALDAETRFALEWHQLHGYKTVTKGAGQAITMLQGFNLSEARMNASGLFLSKGGGAKLLSRDEMPKNWRPSTDDSFTIWEMAQHMARVFLAEDGGYDAAGRLLAEKRLAGPDVLLLAERLFERATNKKEADEALVWNQLQVAWPEIERAADRASEAGVRSAPEQPKFI